MLSPSVVVSSCLKSKKYQDRVLFLYGIGLIMSRNTLSHSFSYIEFNPLFVLCMLVCVFYANHQQILNSKKTNFEHYSLKIYFIYEIAEPNNEKIAQRQSCRFYFPIVCFFTLSYSFKFVCIGYSMK